MVLTSRLYGRRTGRPLRVRKSRLMDELLPQFEIILPPDTTINPNAVFAAGPMPFKPENIWLEIGFGGGEHLAQQAALHPEIGLIGCEHFRNGIASLLDHIERAQLTNIRIFPSDARVLLHALPDASIARCYVLFADPWPKARHAERRFINPDNLTLLRRVLAPGAELVLATDDAQLADWMRNAVAGAPGFKCLRDATTPSDDWIQTRYEEKGIKAGRACAYLRYERSSQ